MLQDPTLTSVDFRHRAAITIQSQIRGYLIRRNAPQIRSRVLFNRLIDKADQASHRLVTQKLIRAIRLAHYNLKEQKQKLLNNYITYCAIKIQ